LHLQALEEKSMPDAEKEVREEFYQFNIAAVTELQALGIFSRDKNTLEIVMYYIIYAAAWLVLYAPGVYDIVLFVFYALNDFGASFELILDDYLSGWSIYAITQAVLGLTSVVIYTYGLGVNIGELVG